jgi:hypothetical protein
MILASNLGRQEDDDLAAALPQAAASAANSRINNLRRSASSVGDLFYNSGIRNVGSVG